MLNVYLISVPMLEAHSYNNSDPKATEEKEEQNKFIKVDIKAENNTCKNKLSHQTVQVSLKNSVNELLEDHFLKFAKS